MMETVALWSLSLDRFGDRHVLGVADGWLVGFNAGEFGGGLWWFSFDGKRSKRISSPWEWR